MALLVVMLSAVAACLASRWIERRGADLRWKALVAFFLFGLWGSIVDLARHGHVTPWSFLIGFLVGGAVLLTARERLSMEDAAALKRERATAKQEALESWRLLRGDGLEGRGGLMTAGGVFTLLGLLASAIVLLVTRDIGVVFLVSTPFYVLAILLTAKHSPLRSLLQPPPQRNDEEGGLGLTR